MRVLIQPRAIQRLTEGVDLSTSGAATAPLDVRFRDKLTAHLAGADVGAAALKLESSLTGDAADADEWELIKDDSGADIALSAAAPLLRSIDVSGVSWVRWTVATTAAGKTSDIREEASP